MSVIEKYEVHQKRVALRSPFKTALREVSEFDIAQVIINGKGIGEAVGVKAVTGESTEKIKDDLLSLNLVGADVTQPADFYHNVISPLNISEGAKTAIDMAVRDLKPSKPISIQSDVTIPIASRDEYPELFAERSEFSSFKIKLSKEPLSELIAKIEIAKEIAPNAPLRVDPNQSWDVAISIDFLNNLEKRGIVIDYLEQPTPRNDFEAFKKIKGEVTTLLMADESCFTREDLLQLIDGGAIDYVNLKILKHGGVTPTLELAQLARSAGLKVSIGSMMESERGVKCAAEIAALIEPDFIHDLDAAWWLTGSSLRYEKGVLFT